MGFFTGINQRVFDSALEEFKNNKTLEVVIYNYAKKNIAMNIQNDAHGTKLSVSADSRSKL